LLVNEQFIDDCSGLSATGFSLLTVFSSTIRLENPCGPTDYGIINYSIIWYTCKMIIEGSFVMGMTSEGMVHGMVEHIMSEPFRLEK
jgi:hypothetical protein